MIAIVSCAGGMVEYRIERGGDGKIVVDVWVYGRTVDEAVFDSHCGTFGKFSEALAWVGRKIDNN